MSVSRPIISDRVPLLLLDLSSCVHQWASGTSPRNGVNLLGGKMPYAVWCWALRDRRGGTLVLCPLTGTGSGQWRISDAPSIW